ncbi:hypothetical protein Sarmat_00199 [Rickettsiales endosymbiont of Paramecium tredecaurelia]|uniref:hypothetical protein n=1 Tax=Candidatus Sarmatiella mevalonica TaxID=2770581 RepID=UPI0019244517|nr:hypothetical protein [Candidatus Sarmatiella mevalonica]MBL3284359.1 hypothetical protein [Candidatus Sarmatiella mevalonica]
MLDLETSSVDQRIFVDLFACILLCSLLVLSYDVNLWLLWQDNLAPTAHHILECVMYLLPALSTLCVCIASWCFTRLIATPTPAAGQQAQRHLAGRAKFMFRIILIPCALSTFNFIVGRIAYLKPEWYSAVAPSLASMQSIFSVISSIASLILLLQLLLTSGVQMSEKLRGARVFYIIQALLLPALGRFVLPRLWLNSFVQTAVDCSLDEAASVMATLALYVIVFYVMICSYKPLSNYLLHNLSHDLSHSVRSQMRCYAMRAFWFAMVGMILCWTGLFLTSFYTQMLNV